MQPQLKKIFIFFTALLLFFLISLLNLKLLSERFFSPYLIFQKYNRSVFRGDYATAYELISRKDRTYKSKTEFVKEKGSASSLDEILEDSLSPLFRLDRIRGNGSRRDFFVVEKLPDTKKGESVELLKNLRAFVKKDLKKDERNQNILDFITRNAVPLQNTTKKYSLVREEGLWKISLNWENTIHIRGLLEEAEKWEAENEPVKALEKYREVLKTDKNNMTAQEKIASLAPVVEKKEYLSRIEFLKMEVKWYKESRGKSLGIFGEIKNNGDKIIKDLRLKVKLLDHNNNVFYEEEIEPLSAETKDKEGFLTPNSVLKFAYRVENPPSIKKVNLSYQVLDIALE
jgi:hypothetical protein